jgi:clostripain
MKIPTSVPAACIILVIALFAPLNARGQSSDPANVRPWTILLYGAVDNSADDPFVDFTDQIRKAIDDDPGIELVMFIDRSAKHRKRKTYLGDDFSGSRLYRVTKNSAERLSGNSQFPEITTDADVSLNAGDASIMGKFIAWGKANYPAKRYALLIYSHADGQSMCPDDASKADMGIAEVTDEIGAEQRVDFLALELCNMGGAEIAYQWRPGNGGFEADVLLAIPNAGPPLDWHRAFDRIRSPGHESNASSTLDPANMSAEDFGKLVIEEGELGRRKSERPGGRGSRESAGCYDLRKAGEVKTALDALAAAMATADCKDAVLQLRKDNSDGEMICYSEDRSYVDVYDLCRRISQCDQLPESVCTAAAKVMEQVDAFMIASFGMSGYGRFEAGKNGVFVVLPPGKQGSWKSYAWYAPTKGTGDDYGNWSFLRDGATADDATVENWYELVVSWFRE